MNYELWCLWAPCRRKSTLVTKKFPLLVALFLDTQIRWKSPITILHIILSYRHFQQNLPLLYWSEKPLNIWPSKKNPVCSDWYPVTKICLGGFSEKNHTCPYIWRIYSSVWIPMLYLKKSFFFFLKVYKWWQNMVNKDLKDLKFPGELFCFF